MAVPAPPSIVIDDPVTSPASVPLAAEIPKPKTPTIDTSPATTTKPKNPTKSLIKRPNSALTTPESAASCYLCDEQNPGDFSPTTKYLDVCLLCTRYFCPVHKAFGSDQVCNINHSTYYHEILMQVRDLIRAQHGGDVSAGGTTVGGRDIAEILIAEGIYPSLGEREKAIFTTSPVDERKVRELESYRSLEAAVVNGGERGKKGSVEEKELVGADVAV